MDQSTMDDDNTLRRERIDALLHQESSYSCPDYLDENFARQEQIPLKPTPLCIIEECAKLFTDLSLEPPPNFHRLHSPASITSTASLVGSVTRSSKFPKDIHQTCLVTWRRQMSTWAYKAIDTFGLDRQLVAIAFNMLDRYLSRELKNGDDFEREDFQLYAMTCLYIAVKILEPTKKLSIPALIDMSRGYYCAEDISETEMEILHVLEWRINGPTPLAFVQEVITSVIPTDLSNDFLVTCQELTEMTVRDEFFVSYRASTIGVAVVLTAARQHKVSTEQQLKKELGECIDFDTTVVTSLCEQFER
jgi:hypothetical protein